jgi:hypothetical protein
MLLMSLEGKTAYSPYFSLARNFDDTHQSGVWNAPSGHQPYIQPFTQERRVEIKCRLPKRPNKSSS